MDLLVEKDDKRTYLSRYKVITTSFEESSPSVKRNNTQIQYRNGNVDFGGWNEAKTIDYVGYYRADDLEDEEYLRERIYALLSDPEGYYITQLKNDNDNSFERPGEASGDYFDKQVNRPSHKRFYVYASSLESELVGSYGGHVLYKISATFTTMKLPYGESVPRDLELKAIVPSENLLVNTSPNSNGETSIYGQTVQFSSGAQYSRSADGETVVFNSDGEKYYRFNTPNTSNISGLIPGKSYYLYGYAMVSKGDLKFRSQYNNGNGFSDFTGSLSDPLITSGQGYKYFYYKFTVPEDAKGIYTSLQLYNADSGDYIRFSKLKLSSVIDFWSPNTSDVEYANFVATLPIPNIPYAGTVPCSQLEQGFIVEFTAKQASGNLVITLNGTKLKYNDQVYSNDVFKLSGYEYTKNGISIVKDTNKAYFKFFPGVTNKISCSIAGAIRILGFQDLYA